MAGASASTEEGARETAAATAPPGLCPAMPMAAAAGGGRGRGKGSRRKADGALAQRGAAAQGRGYGEHVCTGLDQDPDDSTR
jgi:hypothetical protein